MKIRKFNLGGSNSNFGENWNHQWCFTCKYDHLFFTPCELWGKAMFGETPEEHLYCDNQPICLKYEFNKNMKEKYPDNTEQRTDYFNKDLSVYGKENAELVNWAQKEIDAGNVENDEYLAKLKNKTNLNTCKKKETK